MDAKDFVSIRLVIYDCSQRHVLKHIVDLLENRVGVVDVFPQPGSALLPKAPVAVHVSIFVVASQQEDLLGVLQLQRHQQTNHLQTLAAFVDVVT